MKNKILFVLFILAVCILGTVIARSQTITSSQIQGLQAQYQADDAVLNSALQQEIYDNAVINSRQVDYAKQDQIINDNLGFEQAINAEFIAYNEAQNTVNSMDTQGTLNAV